MQLRSFTLHPPIFSSKIINFPELLANFVIDTPILVVLGAIMAYIARSGPVVPERIDLQTS